MTSLANLLLESVRLISIVFPCSRGHDEDDGDNEAVEGEGFSEDHHEDEGNEDILLSIGTHTSVTDNANGKTSGKG